MTRASPRSNDPLFLGPITGLGMPFGPLPNQTRTRQRSCSPAALAWRKAAGGGCHWTGSSDEEGGEEKEKQEEGAGEVGKEKKAGGSGPVFHDGEVCLVQPVD